MKALVILHLLHIAHIPLKVISDAVSNDARISAVCANLVQILVVLSDDIFMI
jgi:hypothetical protein